MVCNWYCVFVGFFLLFMAGECCTAISSVNKTDIIVSFIFPAQFWGISVYLFIIVAVFLLDTGFIDYIVNLRNTVPLASCSIRAVAFVILVITLFIYHQIITVVSFFFFLFFCLNVTISGIVLHDYTSRYMYNWLVIFLTFRLIIVRKWWNFN